MESERIKEEGESFRELTKGITQPLVGEWFMLARYGVKALYWIAMEIAKLREEQ